jgi:hypothetical protein
VIGAVFPLEARNSPDMFIGELEFFSGDVDHQNTFFQVFDW